MILEQLGFIGLGAMGSRMAANLQKISQERLLEFPMGTSLVAPYLAGKRQKIERGD